MFIIVIVKGALPIAKYLAALDGTYNSMFMDTVWKEAFEQSQSSVGMYDTPGNEISPH